MESWKKRARMGLLALIGVGLGGYSLGMGIYAVASTQPGIPSQPASPDEAARVLELLGVAEAYPFASHFIETQHGRMHYADVGQGDPVLLLHGNPTWSFLYRHLLRDLADRQRLIAPDLIGFGLSQKLATPEAYSLEGHIDDVQRLVEALELRNLTLVVQDWGGPIGLGLWLRMPDRIRGLVVMNTYGFEPRAEGRGAGSEIALRAVRAPLMGEQLVQGLGLVQRVFLRSALEMDEVRADAPRPGFQQRVLDAYLEVQGSWPERAGALAFPRWIPSSADDPVASLMTRARARLAASPLPTLIVWGMRDPFLGPAILGEWRAALPAAEVLELADVGHLPPEEAPNEVREAVRRFLGDLSSLAARRGPGGRVVSDG